MEKLLLYKNKPEIFKCQFKVDGIDHSETKVRLCLEFDDNRNMHFYGELDENGGCDIPIPSLTDVKNDEAKLVIEAIADSTYFKVYEAEVKLKNSVDVKLVEAKTSSKPPETTSREPNISLKSFEPQKIKSNPFIPRKK